MPKRLIPHEAFEKARIVHNGIYEYPNEDEYKNISTPVLIRCQHGHEFRQSLRSHIYSKQGCPYCAGVAPLTTKTFIGKAKKIHGDSKFDYSLVNYKNNKTKIEIICCECRHHFMQTPTNHLQGHGCPECAKSHFGDSARSNTSEFIVKAKNIHGDRYDYSKVDYKNGRSKVCIICPIHEEFWMTPQCHLRGQGCPQCKGDSIKKLVYGVGINDTFGREREQKIYDVWSAMLCRCYDESKRTKHPTYNGCSVCDEWLIFSNFQKWYKDNYYEDYAIDKDILVKGNKVYSPDTCCFVPQEINNLLLKSQKMRGKYPIGVGKDKSGKFVARISKSRNGITRRIEIGYYLTPEEAFAAYKREKEHYIQELAQDCYDRGDITEKVYDALMRYEVEITD